MLREVMNDLTSITVLNILRKF